MYDFFSLFMMFFLTDATYTTENTVIFCWKPASCHADWLHLAFLLQIFDGWVLKGEKFPSSYDHPLLPHERYTDYCSSAAKTVASRSSQNVAMIFFRIHSPDSGFSLTFKKLHNPLRESCNTFVIPPLHCKSQKKILLNLGRKYKPWFYNVNLACNLVCLKEMNGIVFVCKRVCSPQIFVLSWALIKAESDVKRLNEKAAPVFQLLDKHHVNTMPSKITITVSRDQNTPRENIFT